MGVVMIWIVLCAALGAEGTPSPDQVRFFETNVRPLLVEQCQKCHGPKKQWANLRVDSREALIRGGDSGPAIAPGNPAASLLIRAVRQGDDKLKMPEDGKLNARQIADLERWVAMGAPFPAATGQAPRSRDPNHWAFQPPIDPPLPAVKDSAWPLTAIDRFVLAKLEEAEILPNRLASKRILIRRITFNLTGLPPKPAEIDEFLADDGPDAYERLVDRLLGSPSYGERWGRHWLDVARYADSNGLDENIAHGNAWRYRDYVVAAFNRDKPFDRFVVEQLAGDLLPSTDLAQQHEQLVATGFLSVGPKVLAEVDQAKMRMDIVDEQIDTTGRAFLGMTLGCARCHDHKFDPISTADYYGLAGIFKSTRSMDTYTKVAKWHEHLLPSDAATAMKAAYDAQVASKKKTLEAFIAQADKQVRDNLPADAKPPEKLEALYPAAAQAELKKLRDELAAFEKDPPDLPAAMGVTEDQVANVAIHVRGNPLKLGDVVARHTPSAMRGPDAPQFSEAESGRRELANWLIDPRHPLTARVFVNRVWRWHFGKGLVRTTDNWGLLGESPSHPELLDSLARRFIADGWSVKSLHRAILTSSVYRQDSQPSPDTIARDSENRLFSRAQVRRLEAEAVRDSLLAVAGQLETTFGGSLLKVKNRAYLFDHTSIDLSDYTSRRRSLYLPVIRNNLYDVFQLLDFSDPAVSTGDRTTTTVAPQALLMMNSDFVMQCAADLAERLRLDASENDQRLARLYALAYGREPSAEETRVNREFLASVNRALSSTEADGAKREQRAWSILCQAVLASSEFLYVK